ncbi:uncharacterized protein LOC142353197 isoform X2 [Convolutriloba macropyga]|uniref:uncharacterized protein LOC142353197 isoform X2 n=1 Tax=Convolutriloba macropyga TaxID=536237 RepID=UPI003F51E798
MKRNLNDSKIAARDSPLKLPRIENSNQHKQLLTVPYHKWHRCQQCFYYYFTTISHLEDILREKKISPLSTDSSHFSLGEDILVTDLLTSSIDDFWREQELITENNNIPIVHSRLRAFIALHKADIAECGLTLTRCCDSRNLYKVQTQGQPIWLTEVRHYSSTY